LTPNRYYLDPDIKGVQMVELSSQFSVLHKLIVISPLIFTKIHPDPHLHVMSAERPLRVEGGIDGP
jgi:hypothetical protein